MKIRLYFDNRPGEDGKKPVRMSVSLLGKRCVTTLGCSMSDDEFRTFLSAYDGSSTATKAKHPRQGELLRLLRNIADRLEWESEKVRRNEQTLAALDIAGVVNECKGRRPKERNTQVDGIRLFATFINEELKHKDLSQATLNQLMIMRRDLQKTYRQLSIDEMATKEWVSSYVDLMVSRGYNSNTVRSKYRSLHWFLKWAFRNDYCDDNFDRYRFELKTVESHERLVIFLTMDELMAIRAYDADPNDVLCKDFFLFQCFTGLRYSDAIKVKNSDIHDGIITIVSQKTGILLHNRLNSYALEIVKKYHNKFGETLFPYVSDGTVNVHIRRICKQVGIMELVTKYEYRDHKRIEITGPKWQFVSTHVGRKSFVVNSLDLGLTPTQVIGYTGHSSIVAMQPYVSISQKKKDAAMDVWDNAIAAKNRDKEVEELNRQIELLKKRVESLKRSDDIED